MTLGSLFDGSGGFALAAEHVGIKPVWASEIEPFPVRVTKKHFPHMKHLGDIRKVHGGEIEPVDIITGSSPCQNLSSAGNKMGLQGEASGLFYEMIRIISQMREATKNKFPKFIVWENVRGALTRKKGEDFSEIIKEFCSTGGQHYTCARPEKWRPAGCVLARDFSFAWRVFDSQYWGIPAMRKRVYAVGCYRPQGGVENTYPLAPSILFDEGDGTVCSSGDCEEETNSAGDCKQDARENNFGMKPPIYSLSRADFHTRAYTNIAPTLAASDYKDAQIVFIPDDDEGTSYSARRLTEKEYAVLQGFPADYCDDLAYDEVTKEDMKFWRDVWDNWCAASGIKNKSDKQIRKWLTTQPSKAGEYKMFGNGVALPIPEYILGKIAKIEK